MISGALARRYAQALIGLASSEMQRDRFSRDLSAVADLLTHPDEAGYTPAEVIATERFLEADRKRLLQTLARRVMVDPTVLKFLEVVFERRRILGITEIARAYQRLADQAANRVQASITSAVPLPPESIQRIKTALERATQKSVVATTHVDPEILGGIIAKVGSVVIDGSVRSTLAQLRNSMRH